MVTEFIPSGRGKMPAQSALVESLSANAEDIFQKTFESMPCEPSEFIAQITTAAAKSWIALPLPKAKWH